MVTRLRQLRRVLAGGGLSILLAVAAPAVARATDLHGDDENDRYVGTGGLLLPSSGADGTRATVAECLGCEWRLASPCLTSDAGNPFSGTPICLSVVRGCPDSAQLLRAWFRPAASDWREIGIVCIGDGGPVTVVDLGSDVREHLVRSVPRVLLAVQPNRGVVTQLPVLFDSGQLARGLRDSFVLAGASVGLVATPSWRWEFGDGARLATTDPGGAYPHDAVAHPYRGAGSYQVRLTTTWIAEFTVDGMGPFPVAESVSQVASVMVRVGEGRAVLAER